MKCIFKFGVLLMAAAHAVAAIQLDVTNPGSIRSAASTIAYGLLSYYTGNVTNTPETIAVLPQPHYWWQAGAMWGIMLDYYHFTGDSSYNDVTTQALVSQVGPQFDYMVPLHELDEANDDQAFWGFATMSAAEKGYPEPEGIDHTWLQLTERLWNTQVRRWDESTCGGGLKWQVFSFNKGYNYKNSVSNGAFFQLSARLARFTGNETYLDWAEKMFKWEEDVGLIDPEFHVYDGTDDLLGCSELNHIEWSYNNAIHLYGAAILYNLTNASPIWTERTTGLLKVSVAFFSPYQNSTNIMYERACEPIQTCNIDQFSFKGYLARFMWATTLVAPFTKDAIGKLLTASAVAASRSCSGGENGVKCGTKWYQESWDGTWGIGQQMSALETIQGLLIDKSIPPLHDDSVQIFPAPVSSIISAPAPDPTTEPDPVKIASSAVAETAADSLSTGDPQPSVEPSSLQSTITPTIKPTIKTTIKTTIKPTIKPTRTEAPKKAAIATVTHIETSLDASPTTNSAEAMGTNASVYFLLCLGVLGLNI